MANHVSTATGRHSAAERLLDAAVELTFPASDPIAIDHAFYAADKRTSRQGGFTMATTAAPESNAPQALKTPNALSDIAVTQISQSLNSLLADTFALYLKTKNFHWHVSGRHFRDYHELFDEQAAQLLAATDDMAERVRKIGGTTLRSIGHIAKLQRVNDNDRDYVAPRDMLRELMEDNKTLIHAMRTSHDIADDYDDIATESLIENWIDEAEKRVWFLFQTHSENQ